MSYGPACIQAHLIHLRNQIVQKEQILFLHDSTVEKKSRRNSMQVLTHIYWFYQPLQSVFN